MPQAEDENALQAEPEASAEAESATPSPDGSASRRRVRSCLIWAIAVFAGLIVLGFVMSIVNPEDSDESGLANLAVGDTAHYDTYSITLNAVSLEGTSIKATVTMDAVEDSTFQASQLVGLLPNDDEVESEDAQEVEVDAGKSYTTTLTYPSPELVALRWMRQDDDEVATWHFESMADQTEATGDDSAPLDLDNLEVGQTAEFADYSLTVDSVEIDELGIALDVDVTFKAKTDCTFDAGCLVGVTRTGARIYNVFGNENIQEMLKTEVPAGESDEVELSFMEEIGEDEGSPLEIVSLEWSYESDEALWHVNTLSMPGSPVLIDRTEKNAGNVDKTALVDALERYRESIGYSDTLASVAQAVLKSQDATQEGVDYLVNELNGVSEDIDYRRSPASYAAVSPSALVADPDAYRAQRIQLSGTVLNIPDDEAFNLSVGDGQIAIVAFNQDVEGLVLYPGSQVTVYGFFEGLEQPDLPRSADYVSVTGIKVKPMVVVIDGKQYGEFL